MTAVVNQDDIKHLLDVLATDPLQRRFEQSIMEQITKQGGEYTFCPDDAKLKNAAGESVAMVWLQAMRSKQMITAEIVSSELELRQRTRLKLTSNGEKLITYLKQMMAAKRNEANSVNA